MTTENKVTKAQSEAPSVETILNDCPFRQHSPECRKFHTAMILAEAKINRLIAKETLKARIDEIEKWIKTLNNTLDLIPDDHEYGSGKKHQQVMILKDLGEHKAELSNNLSKGDVNG